MEPDTPPSEQGSWVSRETLIVMSTSATMLASQACWWVRVDAEEQLEESCEQWWVVNGRGLSPGGSRLPWAECGWGDLQQVKLGKGRLCTPVRKGNSEGG